MQIEYKMNKIIFFGFQSMSIIGGESYAFILRLLDNTYTIIPSLIVKAIPLFHGKK